MQNPVLPSLNQTLADLNVKLGSAQKNYTDSHPIVIGLKQQIADVKRQIANAPKTIDQSSSTVANPVYQSTLTALSANRAASQSAAAQLGRLMQQRAALNPQLAALPGQAQRLAELKRTLTSAESTYNALQRSTTTRRSPARQASAT